MTKELDLKDFFPYKLTQLQAKISNTIADIYTGEFDLSRQEWRILAILGRDIALSAKQVCSQTNLEKMPASRAISKMLARELIFKTLDDKDKRSSLLKLTHKGELLYQEIAPLAVQKEQELLSVFDSKELSQLSSLLNKLLQQSESMLQKQLK